LQEGIKIYIGLGGNPADLMREFGMEAEARLHELPPKDYKRSSAFHHARITVTSLPDGVAAIPVVVRRPIGGWLFRRSKITSQPELSSKPLR